MDAKNKKDAFLRDQKERADKGLSLIDLPEAKALSTEMNDKVVVLNEAEVAAAKADTAHQAQLQAQGAQADLETVLAVVPFMIRQFEPETFAKLPKAESFADTSVDYHRERLLPALLQGDKYCHLMATALSAALDRRDHARHHLATAGTHDKKAKDKEVLARKDLATAIHKAEVFILANTEPGDPARLAIKRTRKPGPRTKAAKVAAYQAKVEQLQALVAKLSQDGSHPTGPAPKEPAPILT